MLTEIAQHGKGSGPEREHLLPLPRLRIGGVHTEWRGGKAMFFALPLSPFSVGCVLITLSAKFHRFLSL